MGAPDAGEAPAARGTGGRSGAGRRRRASDAALAATRPSCRRSTSAAGPCRRRSAGSATRTRAGVRRRPRTEPSGSRTSSGPCRSGSSTTCCSTSWRTCWWPGTTPPSGGCWRPTRRPQRAKAFLEGVRSPRPAGLARPTARPARRHGADATPRLRPATPSQAPTGTEVPSPGRFAGCRPSAFGVSRRRPSGACSPRHRRLSRPRRRPRRGRRSRRSAASAGRRPPRCRWPRRAGGVH